MATYLRYALPPVVGVVSAALQATQGTIAVWISGTPSAMAAGRVGWWELFGLSLPAWLLFAVLVYLASWLAGREPFGRGRLLRPLLVHTVGGLAFAAVLIVVGSMLRYTLFMSGSTELTYADVLARHVESFGNIALLLYWGVVGTWSAVVYYHESRSRAVASARLETLWANARLEALRLQLQPHFLFNALNSIGARAMAAGSRDVAREIRTLGDFLRAHLRTDEHVISLAEDLRLLGLYLRLQELRLEDRLRVEMDVSEAALDAPVPVLTLHTLVENAIRHAVEPSETGGSIRVEAAIHDQRLCLTVADSGGPASPDTKGHGIGLESLRIRTGELFGDSARVTLDMVDGWTRVKVELPLEVQASRAPVAALL